ncbi:hypothetical protein SLW70_03310 [Flavobacterium sp. NG2]|uniref:hypothetical protein n=1 Tax=Flavobacterium sp. NG2 TaxID=3097547 RepID=UPI002A8318B2|nr:hypothetical protein [Flavobacterium sp. NG2]WPR72182.1 hypothetical protein SLW70_03310 [Flavobacterium sp. NG2]
MNIKITLFAIISTSLGFAQDFTTMSVRKTMSQGTQPGIEIFIPKVSEDHIEDAIDEITKPYKGKTRKVKRSDEFYLDNASIGEISPNTIDIHQLLEKKDDGYNYTAYFNLGGVFLDNAYSPEKFAYANEIVKRIALKASELRMDEILKEEDKILRKLEDDKEDLSKDNEKASKDIEKAKDLVAKKEREIEENLKMIESKTADIESQRQKVDALQNERASLLR